MTTTRIDDDALCCWSDGNTGTACKAKHLRAMLRSGCPEMSEEDIERQIFKHVVPEGRAS
jgi:hypothetical protein